jgi:hypothetical protein
MRAPIVLELRPSRRNARNSEGAFVGLAQGRLLFAYTKFGASASDFGAAVICARTSDDGGRTWSARDRVLVAKEGDTNVMSVSLLRLKDGRIALVNLRKDDGQRMCIPWVRFSTDEAQTFGAAVPIVCAPGYYVVNNDRLIQLASGRLLLPMALHRVRGPYEGERLRPGFSAAGLILYYYSDDGGATWREAPGSYYRASRLGEGLQEPGVVELRDGRVWSFSRAEAFGPGPGRQWEALSSDGGLTWTEPRPSPFVSPCSPMSVKRIPETGHLLAVWNDHSGHFQTPRAQPISWGRTPLVCATSLDDGATFGHQLLLEKSPTHGYCYTAIHALDDAVLLAYTAGGKSTRMVLDTLRIRRIPLQELVR